MVYIPDLLCSTRGAASGFHFFPSKNMRLPLLILRAVLLSGLAWATLPVPGRAQAPATSPSPAPAAPAPLSVDISVPLAPTPVRAMGKMDMVYELHLTNFGRTGLLLTGADIFADDAQATPLASYRDKELLKQLSVLNFSETPQAKNLLKAGQRAILFVRLSTDPATAPAALRHRFSFKSAEPADSAGAEQTVDNIRVVAQRNAPTVIAPPLHGRWIAANGLSNDTGHRRALLALGGHARVPQRFATDWVQLGPDGLIARNGDLAKNSSYYGYGAEALAVATATVVAVKDGLPENTPQTKQRAVPVTLETVAGNYVVLNLGNGQYALYGHLQPQSLKVKPGDKVKAGQVLGLVGNSGNSDLPHLHFHLADAAAPLGAEGLPYVFKTLDLQGVVASQTELVKGGFKPGAAPVGKHPLETPVQNAVVVFP